MTLKNRILSLLSTFVFVVASVALTASPASAARTPSFNELDFRIQNHRCVLAEDTGRFLAMIKARSTVKQVPTSDKTYYQEIETRIEVYNFVRERWQREDSEWRDRSRFRARDLPTYSTAADKTVVNGGQNVYRGKFTVKLWQVRTGPDKTVWQTTRYTQNFGCPGQF